MLATLRRFSLFWRLALVLVTSAVATMVFGVWLTGVLRIDAQRLEEDAKRELLEYAGEAEHAWLTGGEPAVAAWLVAMKHRESGDIMVVDSNDQSLSGAALTESERAGLRFQRRVKGLMSFRYGSRMPYIGLPFPLHPEQGRLIIQLPPRHRPGQNWPMVEKLLLVGVPTFSALVLGLLLFWRARLPLLALQGQVLRFKDNPEARIAAPLVDRPDEFGELARSFNRMAEKVSGMLVTQCQLLNDMSHELRTPLSRLSVALEGTLDEASLRGRVAAELKTMRTLVDDTLALGWQETAAREQALEAISIVALWEMVAENAGFESGWALSRFPVSLPEGAAVRANLNTLARVFENLVRNAVRFSPAEGVITLAGHRVEDRWHLTITDQGQGVPESSLEAIFAPFVRLQSARNCGGFGLGLSIASRAVEHLGGEMWAENAHPGLRVHLSLPASDALQDGG